MAKTPRYAVVVPMKNEAENVAFLAEEISAACARDEIEAIFVDDGSTDKTAQIALDLRANYPWLRVLRHENSAGQSAAVHSGVQYAKASMIATIDGDGQNPPSEIPKLIEALSASDEIGLVAGQRVGRQDTLSKRLASKFANALRSWLLKDATRDTGCGLKAFRRDAFLELPFFDHMHRYLPAIFSAAGWEVAHVDVAHRARHAGTSNYSNFQRALVGLYDLIGVVWLLKRRKKARAKELS